MAAALRCAARRLGAPLLQRPPAAVMEERGWLGPTNAGCGRRGATPARAKQVHELPPAISGEAGDVAVRCTARRLGGSLLQPWRTQAAVAEERHRLMPSSLMHSHELSSEVFSERARQTQKEKEQRMEELCKRIAKRDKIRTATGPRKYIELTVTLLAVILGVMMGLAEITVYLFLFILIFG